MDWNMERIANAVNVYTEFGGNWDAQQSAAKFAVDTLDRFEDMGEYARSDVLEVARRLTEGENVNGSWYCDAYKAKKEVLDNFEFFEVAAEYAYDNGIIEGDKPIMNLLDLEGEHVLYRIIGNEMLFAGLYTAFCEDDELADKDTVGDDEYTAFIAYYRGEEC
ncbi:hypothetical protein AGMMS49573_11020 [Endomicrobiia bacterium]|nr:hypothetical protein AGMMS49573_11020 [Endomicrobiia bacterium]